MFLEQRFLSKLIESMMVKHAEHFVMYIIMIFSSLLNDEYSFPFLLARWSKLLVGHGHVIEN